MRMKCGWGHVLSFGRNPNFIAFFFLSLTHKAPDAWQWQDSGRAVCKGLCLTDVWLHHLWTDAKHLSGRGFCRIEKKNPHLLLTNETRPPFTHGIKRVWVRRRDSMLNKNKNTARFIWGPIQTPSMSLTKHVRAYNTLLPLDENASQLLSNLLFTSGLSSWVKVIQVNKKTCREPWRLASMEPNSQPVLASFHHLFIPSLLKQ